MSKYDVFRWFYIRISICCLIGKWGELAISCWKMLYCRALLMEMRLKKFLENQLRLALFLKAIQGSRIDPKDF